ncbi:hypothetical protein HYW32_02870 [Candidatus Berkelbacteria bacterium]|nr:hypothetical protein [Candidatus Berkelbacteria bacterium]
MRQKQLFGKTRRDIAKEEVSANAQFLTRGGFIEKTVAGVYNFLPLGLRVLKNIQEIIREEMNALGANELLLSSLAPVSLWRETDRFENYDALMKAIGANPASRAINATAYILNPTHEEVVTPLVGKFISSYKDLPLAVYQIQTKFRNEPRAKSGLLRGREFSMKDLYSFHRDEADFEKYYTRVAEAYRQIFTRCGLKAIKTEASGGAFSKFSHEFQVITPSGEDTIFYCENCGWSQNREIATLKEGDMCPTCQKTVASAKAIEVGNIFPLKTRFSDAFGLAYADETGKKQPIIMGCYGIGPSRVMGAIVEVHHDKEGIMWPASVAPFQAHLISIQADLEAEKLYQALKEVGIEILYDDRDLSPGQKFADADLIGLPVRLIVSAKTCATDSVELKLRSKSKSELVKRNVLARKIKEG